jgi:hypothetical protein
MEIRYIAALFGGALPLLSSCVSPSPDPLRLAADVAWMADDAREGRRAGTEGESATTEWLAARLEGLGLEPAGASGGWFQEFDVELPPEERDGTAIWAHGVQYTGAESIRPLFCSVEGDLLCNPLVLCGYGVQDEERGWLDFGTEPSLPEGAVVLVTRGLPRGAGGGDTDSSHDDATWGFQGSLFHKVMIAKGFGAAGVLIAQHPDDSSPPVGFDAGSGAVAGIPCAMISAEVAESLAPGYGDVVRLLDGMERRVAPTAFPVSDLGFHVRVAREEGRARNVLARLPGGDGPLVVLGAHLDHLGYGGPGSLAVGTPEIHNGADDNASGCAVLLEAARLLSAGDPPAGDVLFAFWSGEELGLLGSRHFARNPSVDLGGVACNLNLDMVGRAGDGRLSVLGAGSSAAFAGWLAEAGPAAGLELEISLSSQGLGGSDHQVFLEREIPAIHLFSGLHSDYHKPTDDAEGFEADGAAKVTKLVLDLVGRAQSEGLAFKESDVEGTASGRNRRGFRVMFGTVPDYAFDGDGLRLSGTTPGSPAERAGMLPGDILYEVGGIEITTIHDFVHFLQIHKPGDVVSAFFERDGVEIQSFVTLESRELE